MASSLEGNKLLAAVLTAGIIASASGVFSRILYAPHDLVEPVYRVEAKVEAAASKTSEPTKPLPELLAAANVENGEKVAKKCAACHGFDKGGANKVGPNLWGVVAKPIGHAAGFSYSSAITGKGGDWSYEALDKFLENPKSFAPGTKMSFAGLPKASERADVIAYLRSRADSPAPLPQ